MSRQSDPARAAALLGKHLIIGLTYVAHDGTLVEQVQLHGDIMRVDEEVVMVHLHPSGEEFTLPPDLDALTAAPPGEYRFRATGEIVVNPDLMTTWEIRQPALDKGDN